MTRTIRFFGGLLIFLLVCSQAGATWPIGSADGGALWPKRIGVTVQNKTDQPLDTLIPITVGSGENALAIVGERVESLRLFGADGKELLFELHDANAQPLHKERVPDQAVVYLPVTIEPASDALYTLYFGNPKSFPLADWLTANSEPVNTDFEQIESNAPVGWRLDPCDATHTVSLTDEIAHAGSYSIKTVVAENAKSTWIAARQVNVRVQTGQRWRISGFVRGENIKGYAGWYLHIGNDSKPMSASAMLQAGDGSFDWKEVSTEFTVPDGCDRISYGTVLYGTGTAWFDSAKLEKLEDAAAPDYAISVGPTESFPLKIAAPNGMDPDSAQTLDLTPYGFEKNARYAILRVMNDAAARRTLLRFDAKSLLRRFGPGATLRRLTILTPSGEKITPQTWSDSILFDAELPEKSVAYFLAVDSAQGVDAALNRAANSTDDGTTDDSADAAKRSTVGTSAFPGTLAQSDENISGEGDDLANDTSLAFLRSQNMVQNGDLDLGETEPDGWTANLPQGASAARVEHAGGSAWELTVSAEAAPQWPGLRQSIPVEGGRTYLIAYRAENVGSSAPFVLHFHQHQADGSLSTGGMGSAPQTEAIPGWQERSALIKTAPDTERLVIHLTVRTEGTYRFDDILLTEVESGTLVGIGGGRSGAFAVPSVVKVFPDTVFAPETNTLDAQNPAEIFVARNEPETLQIAFRSDTLATYRVTANEPVDAQGKILAAPSVFAVGLVPVDYPTNYYQLPDKKSYERKIPTAPIGCDGWPGWWPDPLIPLRPNKAAGDSNEAQAADADSDETFDPAKVYDNDSARLAAAGKAGLFELVPGTTRALQLLFRTTAETAPGLYTGCVTLENCADGLTQTIPYRVRVFDVTLPELSASGAIYDLRSSGQFNRNDESPEATRKRLIEFMADHRLSPDTLPASPKILYDEATGTASCDWTEFDRVAEWYFDTLHVRWSYMPNRDFYLFGWGMPPKTVEGQTPYEGEYPYDGADRAILRPQFKKAYQARLALFWNHIKEKGWADRFVLYISDEPFYSKPEILAQMKALGAMIHEVDPAILIYSSTWRHVPEWDGTIDVWGIGHYGIVPPEQLEKSKALGDSFWWTTDGQMCLDTPYCAVERLLPWWCWRWGADAYEFWGADWYTYNPFDFGSHSYISQSDTPTNRYFVRYPNGDGYIFYPGKLIGLDEIISSVRCEAARDGQEDALWLARLDEAIASASANAETGAKAGTDHPALQQAVRLREEAAALVPIPVAGGRYSTAFLPNPEKIDALRKQIGEVLEALRSR